MSSYYIHIPFCDTICYYCDFPKRLATEDQKDRYLEALLWEIEEYRADQCSTLYIGGGTPSSFGLKRIKRLFEALPTAIVECTFEMNPKDVNEQILDLLFEVGVTRISLGVQSTNDQLLKAINRDHSWQMIQSAIHLIDRYPFKLNVDLMYNLPNQTIADIDLDLKRMQNVDHISYYSLILEERTVFYKRVMDGSLVLEELDILDEDLAEKLAYYGFKRYEISNYTKSTPSYHNLIYWNNKEYVGIGLGAHGYLNGIRYENTTLLEDYIEKVKSGTLPIKHSFSLTKEDQMMEFFMMGFRKVDGVSLSDFTERYQENAFTVFPALNQLLEDGFLIQDNDTIRPSTKGLTFNNELLVRLM